MYAVADQYIPLFCTDITSKKLTVLLSFTYIWVESLQFKRPETVKWQSYLKKLLFNIKYQVGKPIFLDCDSVAPRLNWA